MVLLWGEGYRSTTDVFFKQVPFEWFQLTRRPLLRPVLIDLEGSDTTHGLVPELFPEWFRTININQYPPAS